MRGRDLHAGVRRAFLLAPLLVVGSVWPAAGAGAAVPAYPVPVVIDDEACDPSQLEVGETCALWQGGSDPTSEVAFANLSLWDLAADAPCTNAGASARSDWIANGYPDALALAGEPPGSAPTYVCNDTGHSFQTFDDLADRIGTIATFPVNRCATQVDADGEVDPCPEEPSRFNIGLLARMRVLAVFRGDDPEAIGVPGGPGGACGLRSVDPNAICLVLEFVSVPGTYQPDVQVGHSHGGPFAGDAVYDPGGPDQTIEEVVTRGERSFVVFKIENDGEVVDTFAIRGPGDRAGLVARYRTAGEDVTRAVVHGRLWIGLGPGSFRLVQLRVHAPADAEPGLVRRWVLTATSEGEPGLADAARAVFRVRR